MYVDHSLYTFLKCNTAIFSTIVYKQIIENMV